MLKIFDPYGFNAYKNILALGLYDECQDIDDPKVPGHRLP